MCAMPAEEGIRSPGTELLLVLNHCVQMGAGNRTGSSGRTALTSEPSPAPARLVSHTCYVAKF